jgi:hypothetical protein
MDARRGQAVAARDDISAIQCETSTRLPGWDMHVEDADAFHGRHARPFLLAQLPAEQARLNPGWTRMDLSAGVLIFTATLSVVTAILVGIAPAWTPTHSSATTPSYALPFPAPLGPPAHAAAASTSS